LYKTAIFVQLLTGLLCLFAKNILLMKNIILLIIVLAFSATVSAQEDKTWKCATDQMYLKALEANPDILIERQKLDAFVKQYIKSGQKTSEVYVIPIVFHVVHNYGPENISYEQILNCVDFMNKDINKLRADTNSIISEFRGIAADCNIEFRLAKIDPDGNCTTGVTRTVSMTTYGGGEDAKEAAPSWPSDMYLNVWSVNSLGNGVAGWSYYPGSAPNGSDGVILLHSYIGSIGTSDSYKGSTLTHEVGHYLNLPHPWGSTNEPGLPSNCEIDDGIEDTPNTIGHTSCDLYANTCGFLDNVQNFMEYSYCGRMFTYGQGDVMRAVLNSDVSGRNNLWTNANRIATGTNEGYVPEICAPLADFAASKKIGCTGFQVEYNDFTYNTDFISSYSWTFDGGEPATSDLQYPIVSYNQKGVFATQLYVENPTDNDSKIIDNYIRVYDKNDGYTVPYIESFDTTTFPNITGNGNNDFYIIKNGNSGWQQSTAGYSGKSIKIVNKQNDLGTNNQIFLPNILLNSTQQPIEVSFKAAYGRSDDLTADRLKFYVSNSCGDTLRIVYVLSGNELLSTFVPSYSNYVPSASHWKTHSFVINPNLLNGENLRVIVEAESGGGNAIYIDEVSYSVYNDVEDYSKLNIASIYPNPFSEEVFIENYNFENEYSVSVYDITGKLLFSEKSDRDIFDATNLFSGLNSGMYFVKIYSGDNVQTIKLLKNTVVR
jgi:hypothetical protein